MELGREIPNGMFVAAMGMYLSGIFFGASIYALLDPDIREWVRTISYIILPASSGALLSLSILLSQMFGSRKDKAEMIGKIDALGEKIDEGNKGIIEKIDALGEKIDEGNKGIIEKIDALGEKIEMPFMEMQPCSTYSDQLTVP